MDNAATATASPAVSPSVSPSVSAAIASSITPTNTTPITLVPATPGLGARWQALPGRTQLAAIVGFAALLAVLAFLGLTARDSDYRPLFPNLSEKDGGQVIDKLTQMNVPYKFAEGGSVILVPSGRVHELRMKLAAGGLPSTGAGAGGNAAGYELLDKNSFGQTQGQERMKMQRAIEGELTTTIQALEGVKAVRVHLALPQQNGFFREQQRPSASVVLTLHPGRTLDRGQIAGIVRVVSGSVPELAAKAVSVVDSTGALLSASADDDGTRGLDSQQLQYRREVEASHLKRVLALLEPVVGRDNLRASVSAEIDFNQVMQTAEAYSPNQGPNARSSVREQRTEDSSQPGGAAAAGGVPGATSNQPPTPATAPINGPAQPLAAAQGNGGAGAATAGAQRREAATRYEVDKTTTVTQSAAGNVKRLSAAVVVNHRSSADPKGKLTTVPLTDKELEQLTALVQQGIGFNAERGDVVKVVNAPFRVDATTPADELPLWKQPWLIDLLKTAAGPAALALVALMIVSKLIRPALHAVLATPLPPPGSAISAVVDGNDGNNLSLSGPGGSRGANNALGSSNNASGNNALGHASNNGLLGNNQDGGANGAQGGNQGNGNNSGNNNNGQAGGKGGNGRATPQAPQPNQRLEAARALAKDNPAAMAHIVRSMVSGDAG